MNLVVYRIFFILSFLAFNSSCSVYKSVGRSQFESKAPSQIESTDIGLRNDEKLQDNCWLQNKEDTTALLASLVDNQKLTIQNINQNEFFVCLESQESL